jgi:hypothetical protein
MRRELIALVLIGCRPPPDTHEEVRRRDEFAQAIARDAGARGVELANAPDVRYESGFSDILYDEELKEKCWPSLPELECARRWQFAGYRKTPFRWLGQHALLRLRSHGDKPMHFVVHGWVDQEALHTTPYISGYVDGRVLTTSDIVPKDGSFTIDAMVPADQLAGREWVGVTLDLSSIGWHWVDVRDLRIAVVDKVEWTE